MAVAVLALVNAIAFSNVGVWPMGAWGSVQMLTFLP